MKRSDIHKIIRDEIQNHRIEEGITNWLVDKVASGFKWYADKKADYQYDALLGSKEFRSLASKYNMSEKNWDKKARELIKKDPQKFADLLVYDVRKGSFSKYFK